MSFRFPVRSPRFAELARGQRVGARRCTRPGLAQWLGACVALVASSSLWAAPKPIEITTRPVNFGDVPPIIDAIVWINQTMFNVWNDPGAANPLPYRAQDNEVFTNAPGAQMFGVPGFDFLTDRYGAKSAMRIWVNEGTIQAADVPPDTISVPEQTSLISVWANQILSPGPLEVSTKGVVRLAGSSIDVSRAGLRAGPALPTLFSYASYLGASNYYNNAGIDDLYWGFGNNNRLGAGGDPIYIPGGFVLPCPFVPSHDVFIPTWPYTNIVFLPVFNLCNYAAEAWTYMLSPTSYVVHVAFYPTNFLDSNFTMTVQFQVLRRDGGGITTFGFHNTEYDIVWRSNVTYSIYLQDDLAFRTNLFYGRNLGATTRRPSTFDLFRGSPYLTNYFGTGGNTPYDPTLLYNPTYRTNVVPITYAAYGAAVYGYILPSPAFLLNNLWDSTNLLGRIDVIGTNVSLHRTRLRGESSLVIQAPALADNRLASVDAPWVNFDIGSTNPHLLITNLSPRQVRRINGTIRCYAAIWDNFQYLPTQTNYIRFHVTFLDHNLSGLQPVVTDRFAAKVGSLTVQDPLTIGKRFHFEGTNLTFNSGGGLTLPVGYSLAGSNLPSLLNFTNEGLITITMAEAHFGDDRFNAQGQPRPLLSFVNRGTNTATSFFIRSGLIFNSGTLEAAGGILSMEAGRVQLQGENIAAVVTNITTNIVLDPIILALVTNVSTNITTNTLAARLTSRSLIEIRAGDMIASNSLIECARLMLSVTNNLWAGDLSAPSTWITTHGFQVPHRTTNGDLMAVTLLTKAVQPFQQVNAVWAGRNLGPVPAGFSNNLALGRLILDGTEESVFRFSGPTSGSGFYVDYIEFQNYATNFFGPRRSIEIDPSLTIFFANANIPAEKLTNTFPGRMQWVPNFLGPLSVTNIFCYCSNADGTITTNSYPMNIALASSKDIDSDADGVVNADDLDPLDHCACSGTLLSLQQLIELFGGSGQPPGQPTDRPRLRVDRDREKDQLILFWDGPAGMLNRLEYCPSLGAGQWQTVTNLATGSVGRRLVVRLPLPPEGQGFYRLRVLSP
jgi:hypothetical protein